MKTFIILITLASICTALRHPFDRQRIVGGDLTTIEQFPFQAALLQDWYNVAFSQICGGTILNARSILTAAHCFVYFVEPIANRVRVGSSYANSGGVVHQASLVTLHPDYFSRTFECDVAIVRTEDIIIYSPAVQPIAVIAGPGYDLPDNDPVVALGWGQTGFFEQPSEQLRVVSIWTVNQATCRSRYMELGDIITNNMLCSGWLDVGGKDQCLGDSGGPLLHNGVLVGVCSWGEECALPRYPGVNARVSRLASWIQTNA